MRKLNVTDTSLPVTDWLIVLSSVCIGSDECANVSLVHLSRKHLSYVLVY